MTSTTKDRIIEPAPSCSAARATPAPASNRSWRRQTLRSGRSTTSSPKARSSSARRLSAPPAGSHPTVREIAMQAPMSSRLSASSSAAPPRRSKKPTTPTPARSRRSPWRSPAPASRCAKRPPRCSRAGSPARPSTSPPPAYPATPHASWRSRCSPAGGRIHLLPRHAHHGAAARGRRNRGHRRTSRSRHRRGPTRPAPGRTTEYADEPRGFIEPTSPLKFARPWPDPEDRPTPPQAAEELGSRP